MAAQLHSAALNVIDRLIDRITMYRLLLYFLLVLLAAAMGLGALGYMPYSPLAIALSAGYLTAVCYVSNKVFAHVYEAPANPESSLITALILALIVTPTADARGYIFLTAAGGLAIASKYILAIERKHIFNPVAVAVALTAIGAGQAASWWVGTTWMAPIVAVGGVLIVRKIKRERMVVTFVAVALVATVIFTFMAGGNIGATLTKTILHSSLLFLAFVMLTEPLTSPGTTGPQLWYAALVGVLIPPQVHFGSVYTTPELALVSGNILSYIISPKVNLLPQLQRIVPWGQTTKDFVFDAGHFKYQPGQYMEFTLPHSHTDSRGSRRYFTLASSPTEDHLHIGVKIFPDGSSFKKAMLTMDDESQIAVGALGGEFVLPKDLTKKLAFIAGGIGVTPFRSMIKYVLDTGQKRDIAMIYSEGSMRELAYSDVFNTAQQTPGIRIIYTITDKAEAVPAGFRTEFVTAEMIAREVPDYAQRVFYISGSHPMVVAVQEALAQLGVPDRHVKIDFFPGYA